MADDPRAKWQQATAEAVIEQNEAEFKQLETELVAAYDSESPEAEKRSAKVDASLDDEWQALKRAAMAEFPEGAKILGLTPKQRLVAIATCLGWTQVKISKASGINRTTINKWLTKRPDIKYFMDEFNLRARHSDVDLIKAKFPSLEYKGVQCVERILSSQDRSEGTQRLQLDAIKWVFDRTRGKPDQPISHKSDDIKTLLAMLTNSAKAPTPEEEANLFKPVTSKATN